MTEIEGAGRITHTCPHGPHGRFVSFSNTCPHGPHLAPTWLLGISARRHLALSPTPGRDTAIVRPRKHCAIFQCAGEHTARPIGRLSQNVSCAVSSIPLHMAKRTSPQVFTPARAKRASKRQFSVRQTQSRLSFHLEAHALGAYVLQS